jgi:hypothetical protein
MQLIGCLLSNFYLNMFRALLRPSSWEQECALPHVVFCTGGDVCGCVELGRKLCVSRTVTFTMHTARVPAPHNHSHHYLCITPYAAVHTLVFLMMGIMMPETCWDRNLIINIRLVASCWFLSLHPMCSTSRFFEMLINGHLIAILVVASRWCLSR